MTSRLVAFYNWLHTHEGRKILRYSTVSLVSALVSVIVLLIVYGALHLWSEVPSTVFANVVAAFPSYWLNRMWAWGKHGRSHLLKEVAPFWIMAAAGIAFSIVGASFARHLAIKYQLSHLDTTLVVVVANVASFGVFWVLKLLVFNRMFRIELQEFDEHLTVEEHEELSHKTEREEGTAAHSTPN